ncbi:Polypeptide N-acetylgalactosaminyltransferase 11 [Myotis brandtii]|uniref:Polypeptide N-acetylgalactosaminyltransferase 11 n=1 Tax=Myotis brandtii TaxID=109478 RepID=S7MDM6_MYOBR|nr:Polypeptide N-acetylgalactosaminyltransferase 11 [Myotis brandtii]
MKCHGLGGSQQWAFGKSNQLSQVSVGQCLRVADPLGHNGYIAMAICDTPLSNGIWKAKVNVMAGMVIHHACPAMGTPREMSRGESRYTVHVGAPSEHQVKYMSPRW